MSFTDLIGPAAKAADQCRVMIKERQASPAPLKLLFHGPPGTGKSALAGLVASSLANEFQIERVNGQSLDIALVRSWRDSMHYRPMFGTWNVKLVDEIDAASKAAQTELLTYLDRCPANTAFLATSNSEIAALTPRLVSRLKPMAISHPTPTEVATWLQSYWEVSPEVARKLSVQHDGDVRATLNALEAFNDSVQVLIQHHKP